MIRHLLAVCLLFFPHLSHGAENVGKVELRFLAERCPKEIGSVVMASGDKRSETFELPTQHLSSPLAAPSREFRLVAPGGNLNLATITLPGEGNAFVILLVPAREGGFRPVAIPTNHEHFRAGDVCFYNHSPQLVFGQIGTEKFQVNPSSGLIVNPKGARKEGFFDVAFYYRGETGARPLSKTRWPSDDKVRTYAFFFLHPETGRIDFRTIDEFLPPPATARVP